MKSKLNLKYKLKLSHKTSHKLLITFVLASLYVTTPSIKTAQAQESVFRCRQNGHTTYSQIPCTQGKAESVIINATPANKQAAAKQRKAHEQRTRDLKKAEAADDKEYARLKKERSKEAQRHNKAEKHCEDLRRKAQWAKEDLRTTPPKSEVKARTKLKRAQQTADAACNGL